MLAVAIFYRWIGWLHRKNRATLRYIILGGPFSAGIKTLDELLKSFLQLPALEELDVTY